MTDNYNTNKVYNACYYIRLSQADRKKGKKFESDSESIKNQREYLTNYIQDLTEKEKVNNHNTINFVDEYVDDGFTGTNFERPDFQRMIEDIEKKKINLVIVKDLSRLGRDHSETGYYAETYFPEHNIRFISVMEHYDTTDPRRQSIQFILAANDYYSEQNSKKIRDILDNKRRNGHFIGSKSCYGYMRDPDDKGHLIPDEKVAFIVKEIFSMASRNVGVSDITSYLNQKGYPTPSKYKFENASISNKLQFKEIWSISSVNKILSNRMYVGDMVQHIQTIASYKSKKKLTVNKSEWTIVENTHEPLVDRDTFYLIQSRRNNKVKHTKPTSLRPIRLFEGMLYCKECGNRLTVAYRKNHDYWSINCNKYSRDPRRRLCEPHFFPYEYLEQQLITKIDSTLSEYIKEIGIANLNDDLANRRKRNEVDYDTKIKRLKQEKEELSNRLFELYNDLRANEVKYDIYSELSKKFSSEIKRLDNEIANLEYEKKKSKNSTSRIPDFTKQIKELLNLKKPKRDLLLTLIEKIEIDKDRNITIIFKYGMLEDIEFKYQETNTPRNPYGKKGKSKSDDTNESPDKLIT